MRMDGDPHLTAWGSLDAEPIGGPRAIDLIPQQVVGGYFLMGTEEKGRITQLDGQGLPQGQGGAVPVSCQGDEPLLHPLRVLEDHLDQAGEENGPFDTVDFAQNPSAYCTFEPPFETTAAPLFPDPHRQEPDQNDMTLTQTPPEDHPSGYLIDVHQLLVPGPTLTTDTDPFPPDTNLLPCCHLAPLDVPFSPDPHSQEPDQNGASLTQTPQEDYPSDYLVDVHQLLVPGPTLTTDTDPFPPDTNLLPRCHLAPLDVPFSSDPHSQESDQNGESLTQTPQGDLPSDYLLNVHQLLVPGPPLTTDTDPLPADTDLLPHRDSTQNSSSYCMFEPPSKTAPAPLSPHPASQEPVQNDTSQTHIPQEDRLLDVHQLIVPEPSLPPDSEALLPNTNILSYSLLTPLNLSLESDQNPSSYCTFESPSETAPVTHSPQEDQPGPTLPTDNDLSDLDTDLLHHFPVDSDQNPLSYCTVELPSEAAPAPLSPDPVSQEPHQNVLSLTNTLEHHPLDVHQLPVPGPALANVNDLLHPETDPLHSDPDLFLSCPPESASQILVPHNRLFATETRQESDCKPPSFDYLSPEISPADTDLLPQCPLESASQILVPHEGLLDLLFATEDLENDCKPPSFDYLYPKTDQIPPAECLPRTDDHSLTADAPVEQTHQSGDALLHPDVVELPQSKSNVDVDTVESPQTSSQVNSDATQLSHAESNMDVDAEDLPQSSSRLELDAAQLSQSEPNMDFDAEDLPKSSSRLDSDAAQLPQSESCLDLHTVQLPHSTNYLNSDPLSQSLLYSDVLPQSESCLNSDVDDLPEAETCLNLGAAELPEAESCVLSNTNDPDEADYFFNLEGDLPEAEACLSLNVSELPESDTYLSPGFGDLPEAEDFEVDNVRELPEAESFLNPEVDELPEVEAGLNAGSEPTEAESGSADLSDYLSQPESCLHPDMDQLPQSDSSLVESYIDCDTDQLSCPEPFLNPECDLLTHSKPCLTSDVDQFPQTESHLHLVAYTSAQPESYHLTSSWASSSEPLALSDGVLDHGTNMKSNISLEYSLHPNSCPQLAFDSGLDTESNHILQSEPFLNSDADQIDLASQSEFYLALKEDPCSAPEMVSQSDIGYPVQSECCLNSQSEQISDTHLDQNTKNLAHGDSNLSLKIDQLALSDSFFPTDPNHLPQSDCLTSPEPELCLDSDLSHSKSYLELDTVQLSLDPRACQIPDSESCLNPVVNHLPLSGLCLDSDTEPVLLSETFLAHENDQLICSISESDSGLMSQSETSSSNDQTSSFSDFADEGIIGSDHLVACENPSMNNDDQLPVVTLCDEEELFCLCETFLALDIDQISLMEAPDLGHVLVSESVLTHDPKPLVQSPLPKTSEIDHLPLSDSVLANDTDQISVLKTPDPDYVPVSKSVLTHDPKPKDPLTFPQIPDIEPLAVSNSALSIDTHQISVLGATDHIPFSVSVLTNGPEPTVPSPLPKTPNIDHLPLSKSVTAIDTDQISLPVASDSDHILVSDSVLPHDSEPMVQSPLSKTPDTDTLLFSVSAIDANQICLPESPNPDYVSVSQSVLINDSDQNQLDLPMSSNTSPFPSSDSVLANETDLFTVLPQDALPFTVADSTDHKLHETGGDLKLDSRLKDDSDQDSPSESSHSTHEMPFIDPTLPSTAGQVPPSKPFFANQLPLDNTPLVSTGHLPLLDSYLKNDKFDSSLHNRLPFLGDTDQLIQSSTGHLSNQLPPPESFHDLDLLHISDCLFAPNLSDLNLSDLCLAGDIDHFPLGVTSVVPGNEMSLFDEFLACDANQSLAPESIVNPTSDDLSLFESCLSDNVGHSLLSHMSVLPHDQLPFSDSNAPLKDNNAQSCQSLTSPEIDHLLAQSLVESSTGQLPQSESCLASNVDQQGSAYQSSIVSASHFAQISPGHTSFSNSIVEEFQIPWDWTSNLDHADFAGVGLDCGSDAELTGTSLDCGAGGDLVCGLEARFTGIGLECESDSGFTGVDLDCGPKTGFTRDALECDSDAQITEVGLNCGKDTEFTGCSVLNAGFTGVSLDCGSEAGFTKDTLKCGSDVQFTEVGSDLGTDPEITGVGLECPLGAGFTGDCGSDTRITGVGLDCGLKVKFTGVGLDCGQDTQFVVVHLDFDSDPKSTGVGLDCGSNAEFPGVSLDCGSDAEFSGVSLDGGSDILLNVCPKEPISQEHEIDDSLPLFCLDTPPESPIDPQETDSLTLSDDLLSLCDVFSQLQANEIDDGELCCTLDSLSLQQADGEFRTDQISMIEEMPSLRDLNLPHMPIAYVQDGPNFDGSDNKHLDDDFDQSDSYCLDLLFDPKLDLCEVQGSLVGSCPQLHLDPAFGNISANEAGHLLCDITKPSQSGVYETQPTLPLESLCFGDHLPPACHSDPSLNNIDLAQSDLYVATEMGSASQLLGETDHWPLSSGKDLLDDIPETNKQDVLLANPQEGLPPDKSVQPEMDTSVQEEEVSSCDLKGPVLFRSCEPECSQVTARLSGSGEKVSSDDTTHSKPNIGFEDPPSLQGDGGGVEQIEKLALSHTASPLENTQVLPCDSHPPADSQDSASAPFSFGDGDPFLGFALDNDSPCVGDELARLRAVFDALDRDKDGFVKMEDFVQFATVYGAEQVKYLTGYLDPAGLGVINFRDFYRGISEIQNEDLDMQLYDMGFPSEGEPACSVDFDDLAAFEVTEVTDSAYVGSESAYSECETFTDEDTGGLAAQEDPETEGDGAGSRRHTSASPEGLELSLCDISVVTVSGQEEQFEDFGEGAEPDLFNSHCEDEPDSFTQTSNGTQRLTSSGAPMSERQLLAPPPCSGLGGLYCSQCHKHINRLEDLSTRLRYLEMDSPDKRTCSRKEARRLHNSGFLGEEPVEEQQTQMAYDDTDLTDKVLYLEQRVSELERDAATTSEQQNRLRQENLQLLHRVHALEEQLKDQELRSDEVQSEETRKHRDELRKMERDRSYRLTSLKARLQELESENIDLRSQLPSFKATTQRLEEEKHKLLDQVEDLQCQLQDHQEQNRKLGGKLSKELHKQQTEKERCQEVIEELRRELEQMQLIRLEMEQKMGLGNSAALQEYNSRTREAELEQEVRRLKQEQRALKEQNEELNGQIINLSIQGAKNLFSTTFSDSLAAEISSVSRDELMEAIQKQEEINLRLQDYIDRIIVAIMETNPAILEVKIH